LLNAYQAHRPKPALRFLLITEDRMGERRVLWIGPL